MQRLYCLETLAGCNQKVLNANEILWWSALHIEAVDRNLVDGNPLWRSFPGRDSDQFEFVKSCQVFGGLSLARFSGLSLGRCHEAEKWCGLGMRRAPDLRSTITYLHISQCNNKVVTVFILPSFEKWLWPSFVLVIS